MEVPASLSIGTQVSAKYKGAFCEAKVKSVLKQVKCRVTFSSGLGSATLSDELIKFEGGNLSVGLLVEARHPEKNDYRQATINKIQDQSQYTVVFDDGDITTLRRNALCMKSGKHYNASESLDNLPLTHPEHFSTPVSGSRRRKRGGAGGLIKESEPEIEESSCSDTEEGVSSCYLSNIGRVVWTENTENKKYKVKDTWFPALIVAPSASDTVKINTKEEFLIRSFKDGRYYTVRKKDTNQFKKDSPKKSDNPLIKEAMEKAIAYMEMKELPPHWDKEHLFNMGGREESSTESSESEEIEDDENEESREEKDHLVAELYKHMEDRGAPINRTPNIVGKDLDLYKLFRIVYKYGGHQRVTNNNKWRQIAHKLGFETTWCVNQVRVNYKRYLQSFEELYKTLGCTMKSGSSTKQRQNSGNGSSGRVQIRGRSREMLKQQTNSSKDEDTASESSKDLGSDLSTAEELKDPAAASLLPCIVKKEEETPKEEEEESEEPPPLTTAAETSVSEESSTNIQPHPTSSSKKTSKEKKTMSASKSSESLSGRKGSKDESSSKQPLGTTRNRRDSNSSTNSSSAAKGIKEEPSAKKSLSKELSEIDVGNKKASSKPAAAAASACGKLSTADTTPTTTSVVDEPAPKGPKGRKKISKESKKAVGSSQSSSNANTATAPTAVAATPASTSSTSSSSSCNPSTEESSDSGKSRSSDSAGEEEAQYLSPDVDVRVGDKIKVFYIRGIIYDAKVIKIQEQEKSSSSSKWPRYYVHYQGWNARYDEWINRSRIAENLSWSKDRPKKDGKEGDPGGEAPPPVVPATESRKREKAVKVVDGRKERKVLKRDSSRASTPGKSEPSKRGTRGGKKAESDEDEDESVPEKNNGKSPGRGALSKKITPHKRGRGRKRKDESENEEVDIEKEDGGEEEPPPSSPTKAKRGRKAKKEEEDTAVEESKKPRGRGSFKSKDSSEKKPPVIKKEEEIESISSGEAKGGSKSGDEDPYAFKEPEPFEEVKFETPPRKVHTPPAAVPSSPAKKNVEKEEPSPPAKKSEDPGPSPKQNDDEDKQPPEKNPPPHSNNPLPIKLDEDDYEVEEDSDDEGKLEIVTPKKEGPEEGSSPLKEEVLPPEEGGEPIVESIDDQPSVIIEIKKSPEKPSDDPGKPVLQLTEKQKELFPFLSAIRTASLGSIGASAAEGPSKDEPAPQEIKIEVTTSPTKKPAPPIVLNSSPVVGGKKRKSNRRFNSSELVIESESEEEEEETRPKPPQVAAKVTPPPPIPAVAALFPASATTSPTSSTKPPPPPPTVKKVAVLISKKDSEFDDVDLACAETIPGSPVHVPDGGGEPVKAEDNKLMSTHHHQVLEVKKLEMPFATVPESGLGPPPTQEDEDIESTPSLPPPKKALDVPPHPKTEKKEPTMETAGAALVGVAPPNKVLLGSSSASPPPLLPSSDKDVEQMLPASCLLTKDSAPDSSESNAASSTDAPDLLPLPPTSSLPTPTTSFKPLLPEPGYKSPSSSDVDKPKSEPEMDARLDVDGSSSSGEPPTQITRRSTGPNKRKVSSDKLPNHPSESPRSPAQKRKRRTRDLNNASASNPMLASRYRGSSRGRHGSGRGVGLRGNLLDEETDHDSEETKDSALNSLGSLDDQALMALSQRSPKSSRYNFCVALDPSMNSSERISLIQQNLEELRKTYLNVKSELAVIEKRRKKIRRKKQEQRGSINSSSSGSNSGGGGGPSKSNPAHIEVTA